MVEFEGSSKPKEGGLPEVTFETLESIIDDYIKEDKWEEYLKKFKAKLELDNPILLIFVNLQSNKYPKEMREPIRKAIIGTLAVLEHQANKDKLASVTEKPSGRH